MTDSPNASCVQVHGLRHTFATNLAHANVSASVYELETLQRYVDGAGQETRAAAARDHLCERLRGETVWTALPLPGGAVGADL